MSTVIFAWELGGGLGHVRPLLEVARALAARGHKPVFAVRNVPDTWPALRDSGFPVLQAPFRPGAPKLSTDLRGRTYADILSLAGWSDPEELEGVIRAWDGLTGLLRPALAVVDHAPALTLAARGAFPVVQVGTGFIVPPVHLPEFPVLRPAVPDLVPLPELYASIVEVQRRRGRPAPSSVPALFDAGPSFVTCLPEFDPYRDVRRQPHLGPIEPLPDPSPLPGPPSWFAYLAADACSARDLLHSFVATGLPGSAWVSGLGQPARDQWRREGLPVLDAPAAIGGVLAKIPVVVHNGGTGLGSAALAAGCPQLIVPTQLEQELTAKHLVELGVALDIHVGDDPGEKLLRLASELEFAGAAFQAAERVRRGGPWRALETVVDGCLALLQGGTPP
ncbi:MAG: hypothetical protein K8T20_13480 [Planctomycetes bacterium]|nr:hypothetical protein [Planctomycetota bacterium]